MESDPYYETENLYEEDPYVEEWAFEGEEQA